MSTTETVTETRAASLALRSQPHNDEDNKSQESYSTVVEAETSQSENKAQVSKQEESNTIDVRSDSDEEDPSPCGRCRKMVVRGDEALMCEICSQWFHIKCEKVTKAQYKNQASKTKSNFHWYCDACDIVQSGIIREITILKSQQSQFKKKLDELEEKKVDKEDLQKELDKKAAKEDVEKLEERINTMEGKQATSGESSTVNPQASTSSGNGNTMEDVIKEMKDQEDRKRNIIFFNIPESKAKDMNERTKHDKEEVKEITKICNATIKKDDMLKAKRLGKKSEDKPRPLLIEVSNDEKKSVLFKNLSKLQNAPDKYKAVSVQNDLTQKQRAQEKILREEAKKKEQEASGEAKFKVRGPPWDRKIVKIQTKKSN